jgi:hypothetical protein
MKPSVFKKPAVAFVAAILTLETLAATGVTGLLVWDIATQTPDSVSSAVALVLMVAGATLWIALTTIAFIRGRSSSRGSALVWQVLQAALGMASNQGVFARPDIGGALLVPALAAIALLLFSRSVSEHLGTREEN